MGRFLARRGGLRRGRDEVVVADDRSDPTATGAVEGAGEAPRHDGGGERASRPSGRGDEPRRRRSGARQAGFGDGVERVVCRERGHIPPREFPVAHRSGTATLRSVVVDRRDGSVLLCDACHSGPHRWPGGELVEG